MTTITVSGNNTTATIVTVDPDTPGHQYQCSQGAWCPFEEESEHIFWTIGDVIAAAEIHCDRHDAISER